MEQERKYKGFWWESQKERDHLEDQNESLGDWLGE
jgi:hypothetical protein